MGIVSDGTQFPELDVGNASGDGISERMEMTPEESDGPVAKKRKTEEKPASVPRLPRRKDGFSIGKYYETDYYVENGLRKVYPYFFTFTSHAKGRWVGRKMMDVFSREFRLLPPEVYKRHAELGRCLVNYERADLDYVIQHNDLISNVVHRHEVPVTCAPLKIIHSDDDVLVIDKPSSIPVHPVGRYRHNTVVWILAQEYGIGDLHTVHRLDRLTSGVLIFARRIPVARKLEEQIKSRSLTKDYLCKVVGKFPNVVSCDQPIKTISHKIGVCRTAADGKDCYTDFEGLHYDEGANTSIVSCRPRTGRMHQIRVHLQFLGYPIVDDPLYNSDAFGSKRGAGGDFDGMTDDELIARLIRRHNAENWLVDGVDGAVLADENCGGGNEARFDPAASNKAEGSSESGNVDGDAFSRGVQTSDAEAGNGAPDASGAEVLGDRKFDPDKVTFDPHCLECKRTYKDPTPAELTMCLHAWKYRGVGWSYESEMPEWARYE